MDVDVFARDNGVTWPIVKWPNKDRPSLTSNGGPLKIKHEYSVLTENADISLRESTVELVYDVEDGECWETI